jgi:trans-2,3-dihydro-3-hydroxyanthranilate isomerase
MGMPVKEYFTVDVFSAKKYAGNQLAVFTDGRLYSDAEMQQITREMNYSETTFIIPPANPDGSYRVRIFTQAKEVPFAGHPTLGTAYIILREYIREKKDEVVLDLAVGKIPVKVDYADGAPARLTMRQNQPTFGATVPPAEIAAALGLREDEIDARYPAEEVSTGLPFLIVPLLNLAAVKRIRLDHAKCAELFTGLAANGVFCFSPETYTPENTLNARMLGYGVGVAEDPATGSASGCLVAYLLRHSYLGKKEFAVSIEQGYEIGRDSILYLSGSQQNGTYNIYVGGAVVPVARGQLL